MADPRQFRSLKSLLTTGPARDAGVRSGIAVSGPSEADLAAHQAAELARAAQHRAAEQAAQAALEQVEARMAAEAAERRDAEPEMTGEADDASYVESDGEGEESAYDDEGELVAEYHEIAPEPPPPSMPQADPVRARFADVVVYDGSFDPVRDAVANVISEGVNELARLRARAAEAFEVQAETMLADLASTVLARELATSPADIKEIVRRALADFQASGPVRVRVSPEEAEAVGAAVPVVVDGSLSVGDLIVDVADGALDLRLGTRISAVLRAQMVHL